MRRGWVFGQFAVFLLLCAIPVVVNSRAVSRRHYPEKGNLRFYRVSRGRDVYRVYRMLNLRGATVVHLSNTLNTEEYYPAEETEPIGYPIPVRDVLPLYEEGLNGGNYLFIATRASMVRRIFNILPESVFRLKSERMVNQFEYTVGSASIEGYVRDIKQVITTVDALKVIKEPVVVNIDAGYFIEGQDPMRTVVQLIKRCKDIRAIVFIDSADRDYVTPEMRRRLEQTLNALKRALL